MTPGDPWLTARLFEGPAPPQPGHLWSRQHLSARLPAVPPLHGETPSHTYKEKPSVAKRRLKLTQGNKHQGHCQLKRGRIVSWVTGQGEPGQSGREPPLLRHFCFCFLWVDSGSGHATGTHARPGAPGARLPATSQERVRGGQDAPGRCGTLRRGARCEGRLGRAQGPTRGADRQAASVHTRAFIKQDRPA